MLVGQQNIYLQWNSIVNYYKKYYILNKNCVTNTS